MTYKRNAVRTEILNLWSSNASVYHFRFIARWSSARFVACHVIDFVHVVSGRRPRRRRHKSLLLKGRGSSSTNVGFGQLPRRSILRRNKQRTGMEEDRQQPTGKILSSGRKKIEIKDFFSIVKGQQRKRTNFATKDALFEKEKRRRGVSVLLVCVLERVFLPPSFPFPTSPTFQEHFYSPSLFLFLLLFLSPTVICRRTIMAPSADRLGPLCACECVDPGSWMFCLHFTWNEGTRTETPTTLCEVAHCRSLHRSQ